MGDPEAKSLECCKIREDKISEIDKRKKISALLTEFNENQQASSAFCSSCIDYMNLDSEVPQDSQKTAKRMCSSPAEGNSSKLGESSMEEHPWNTIIVNQIPLKFDLNEFTSVFSQYGAIEDVYLDICSKDENDGAKRERIARVRFTHEEDARKVWEAGQEKLIRLGDNILMITLVFNNYSPIEDLPNDCLREIFRLLPVEDKLHVEKVCTRWKKIGSQSYSHVNEIRDGWTSDAWKTIAPRTADFLRNLILRLPEQMPMDDGNLDEDSPYVTMALISKHYTGLQRLGISWNSDSLDESDEQYSKYIPQLHSIILKNQYLRILHLRYVPLNEGFFDWLPGEMKEIHVQSNEKDWDLQVNGAPVNLSRFLNLETLALFGFRISENQLMGIEYLENLRTLNLHGSDVHPSNIEKIVHLKKLEHLAINKCQISNLALMKILRNNKELKYLDISDIETVRDSAFQYVLQLPKLEVLWMKNLREVSCLAAMPQLRILKAYGCSLLTDEEIQRLFTRDSALEELNICGCSTTLSILISVLQFLVVTRPKAILFHLKVNKETNQMWHRLYSNEFLPARACGSILFPFLFVNEYNTKNDDDDDPADDDWSHFDY